MENWLHLYQCGCIYSYDQIGRKIHYRSHLRRWSHTWIPKSRSTKVVERSTYKRIQHKGSGKSQNDHWMEDYLWERYPQNEWKRIHTRSFRIWSNDFILSQHSPSKSRFHPHLRPNKRPSASWSYCLSMTNRQAHVSNYRTRPDIAL